MKKIILVSMIILLVSIIGFSLGKYNQREMDLNALIQQPYVTDPTHIFIEYSTNEFPITHIVALNDYINLMIIDYFENIREGKKPPYSKDEIFGWAFLDSDEIQYQTDLGKILLENYYSTKDTDFTYKMFIIIDYLEYRMSQEFLDKDNIPYDVDWKEERPEYIEHLNISKVYPCYYGIIESEPFLIFYTSNLDNDDLIKEQKEKFQNIINRLSIIEASDTFEQYQNEVLDIVNLNKVQYIYTNRILSYLISFDILAFLDSDFNVVYVMVSVLNTSKNI